MDNSMWGYEAASGYQTGIDLTGYRVEATDGRIGKVEEHSAEVDAQYIVVDTGPWIFGRHVLLPAGTVIAVDNLNKAIQVGRSKDEIKDSPEYRKDKHFGDPDYRKDISTYYGRGLL